MKGIEILKKWAGAGLPPRERLIWRLCLLLLAPALLINLGLMTFIDDEGIRSLVALEMELSGNWIVPTMHGELYFKKPPLFNWILLGWFHLAGGPGEWVARLATVFSLLGYLITMAWFFRKQSTAAGGMLAALAFLTCGRVLLWDSQLGLIDITFSWVIFGLFISIYLFFEKKQWWALFLVSYALAAVGFLFKGLPAVVFQGFTLLAWFTYRREFRRLFSWAHVGGGLLFLAIVGGYYLLYWRQAPVDNLFSTLVSESSRRTAVRFGLWPTVRHFFTFPFEMVYHFFPWSLTGIYLLVREKREFLRRDRLSQFLAITFLANIVLYWTSVEVYPRYLLMHAPLYFGLMLRLRDQGPSWADRILEGAFGIWLGLQALSSLLPFFWERAQLTEGYWWKGLILLGLSVPLAVYYWKWKGQRLWVAVAALLVMRLGFNWFVLPDRYRNDWGTEVKRSTIEAIERIPAGAVLYIYKATALQPTNSFYATRAWEGIIPVKHEGFQPGDYLIVDPDEYPKVQLADPSPVYLRMNQDTLWLGRLENLQ